MRIAWMIERHIPYGKDWVPFKVAGKPGTYVTRASARREAVRLNAEDARLGRAGMKASGKYKESANSRACVAEWRRTHPQTQAKVARRVAFLRLRAWEYRAVPYLPRVDSTGRRR